MRPGRFPLASKAGQFASMRFAAKLLLVILSLSSKKGATIRIGQELVAILWRD